MGDDEGSTGSFRQVEDWLRSLGLICYAQSFYDNGYENIDICRQIEEQDLIAIGISNVKDKSDIIAGVCRLKQKAVYFELEPEQEESTEIIRRKYDPFLLITRVKAELEKSNTQLTEPPYFYPDGSLGSLDSLAETLSYTLETFMEDVLDALDQLRRRQLPAGLYNDVHELMELQRQQEVKKPLNQKLIGPPKPKRESVEEPKAYLNVETPFRRTTSLSKHDHRITKSTTNLADIDFGEEKYLVSGSQKKVKKPKAVVKSYSTRDKNKSFFSKSTRKRSTTAENKGSTNSREEFVAKHSTMNQQDLIDLLTRVKHGEISQDNAAAMATMHYQQSTGPQTSSKNLEKHQLTKKEKKKLDKEEKKRKKDREKAAGRSLFYFSDINESEPSIISRSDNRQVDEVISLGNSSGSDISRESPDLRSFGEGKVKSLLTNGSALNTSEDSMHSSTGSLNSTQCATSNEPGAKSRSNSVKSVTTKPAKQPPPIPSRSDHSAEHTSNSSIANQQSYGNALSSFATKKTLKSVLSAPLSERSTDTAVARSELSSSKSQEFVGRTCDNNTAKEHASSTNTVPFGQTALAEIKQKSLERTKRMTMSGTDKDELCKEKSAAIRTVPKPPERIDKSVAVKTPSVTIALVPPSERGELGGSDKIESGTKVTDKVVTEEIVVEKQKPAPPPRRIDKDAEKRPVIPPRKRHSILNEGKDKKAGDIIPQEKPGPDYTVPGAVRPVAKPKPSLPPRSVPNNANEVGKSAKETERAPGTSNALSTKRDSAQLPDSHVKSIKSEEILRAAKTTFTPRSIKQLIEMKCNLERVDLSEYPYSGQDGSWNVPHLLTKRYAEELEQPIAHIIDAMDALRVEQVEKTGKVAKRAIVNDVMQSTVCDASMTTLKDWLVSRGLPMFVKDFHECGLVSIENLRTMTKKDILLTGVFDTRHVDRLLAYLQ